MSALKKFSQLANMFKGNKAKKKGAKRPSPSKPQKPAQKVVPLRQDTLEKRQVERLSAHINDKIAKDPELAKKAALVLELLLKSSGKNSP